MSESRFSISSSSSTRYRLMWILLMFDLPTYTKDDRRVASKFRSFLENEGFKMEQYSVYLKYVGKREKLSSLARRIKSNLPKVGRVLYLEFTDKQIDNINYLLRNYVTRKQYDDSQMCLFE